MRGARSRGLVARLLAALLLILPGSSFAPATRALELLPPIGVADTLTVVHDRTAVVPPPGVLGNDLDLDGGARAVLDSPPRHGTVSLRSDGGYTYKPNAGYVGTDVFYYHATSLLLSSLSTPVNITITNAAPIAVNDSYSGTTGSPLVVAAPGVLKNDSDADGDPLRAELLGGISNGSIDLDPNGGFVYDPGGGDFSGTTSFQYRIWDGVAWSATATVTITMSPTPTPTPTPKPTPTPTPSPTPTPTPSPTPTPLLPPLPIATPTLPPLPLPTATLPPLPLPTATLPPLPLPTATLPPLPIPTATPTPTPRSTPTVRPTPDPTASSTPTPSPIASEPSPSPSSSPLPAGAGSSGGTPPPATDPFSLPPARFDPFDGLFGGFDGFAGFEWAIPAIALAVPGLLLLVALLAQAAIGIVWLPMVRRHLAGVGLRRRREHVRS